MKKWLRYLRLRPFDVATEAGRSEERYRLALWSIVANVLSKSVAMLVMLLSVSWTLPYLGAERFGVWMTIASFVSMLLFLDLGIGNALTNHVADAAAVANSDLLVDRISGGLGLVFIVGVLSSLLLSALVAILPWASIIKVQDPLVQREVSDALFLFAILFGLSLFSNGVHRVFAGLQRSFEGHVAAAIGSLLSILTLWWAAASQAGVATLLLATLGWQSASSLILLCLLVKRRQLRLQGIGAAIRAGKAPLLKTGGLFFILQIGTMVGWGADSLIISSTLGAAQVAIFSVTQRLFQFVTIPLAITNAPLWGAYADARARGDKNFILKTLNKSLLLTGGATLLGSGLLLFVGPELIQHWTLGNLAVPFTLILTMAIWTLCETVGNSFAMMMNGCGIVKPQVIAVSVFVFLALPLKTVAVHIGLPWMVAATIVSYVLAVPVLYAILFKIAKFEVFK